MSTSLKILISIVIVFVGIFSWYQYTTHQKNSTKLNNNINIEAPKLITLQGEYVCLPHKDTSGPQTLECAYGIKSKGLFYALDLNPLGSDAVFDFQTGKKVEVEGTFTPIEYLSTNHWQKYNVKGIITVESLKNI